MIIYTLIAALVIAADQFTKYLVRSGMQPGSRIPLLGDWLSLYYVRNTGTAFSMFEGNRWITVALTAALIIICLVVVVREARAGSKTLAILVTFVFAGGLSNFIDRLSLGYVTDMISCWSFAVFNVADIAVTCGCVLTALWLIVSSKKEEAKDDDSKDIAEKTDNDKDEE